MKIRRTLFALCLATSSAAAYAAEQCPASYLDGQQEIAYSALFEKISQGPSYQPMLVPEGLAGDPVYPRLFSAYAANFRIDPLTHQAWTTWSSHDWRTLSHALELLSPRLDSQHQEQLSQVLAGVSCYAKQYS